MYIDAAITTEDWVDTALRNKGRLDAVEVSALPVQGPHAPHGHSAAQRPARLSDWRRHALAQANSTRRCARRRALAVPGVGRTVRRHPYGSLRLLRPPTTAALPALGHSGARHRAGLARYHRPAAEAAVALVQRRHQRRVLLPVEPAHAREAALAVRRDIRLTKTMLAFVAIKREFAAHLLRPIPAVLTRKA